MLEQIYTGTGNEGGAEGCIYQEFPVRRLAETGSVGLSSTVELVRLTDEIDRVLTVPDAPGFVDNFVQ